MILLTNGSIRSVIHKSYIPTKWRIWLFCAIFPLTKIYWSTVFDLRRMTSWDLLAMSEGWMVRKWRVTLGLVSPNIYSVFSWSFSIFAGAQRASHFSLVLAGVIVPCAQIHNDDMLEEIARLLQPGGRVVIREPTCPIGKPVAELFPSCSHCCFSLRPHAKKSHVLVGLSYDNRGSHCLSDEVDLALKPLVHAQCSSMKSRKGHSTFCGVLWHSARFACVLDKLQAILQTGVLLVC